MATAHSPGYGTEYSDNYCIETGMMASRARREASFLNQPRECVQTQAPPPGQSETANQYQQDSATFSSDQYPGVFREPVVHKDERGHYIDPFKDHISKPSGRRLLHDETHPNKIYSSQWSSELADAPGPYSFPTTTGLDPDVPFNKDLQWQAEGEVGQWPTNLWKHWRSVATCPTYGGHDDQMEYSKYKVQVP